MITDNETNFLYLADSLKKPKYSNFLKQFENVLNENNIEFEYLSNTKDIWTVDYMPIQITANKFIQFEYDPDYLKTIIGAKSKSDVDAICREINIVPTKSNIVGDGGNVVRWKDKVIMCDKVFKENPEFPEKDLIKKLKELLEVDKLIFVPRDKNDFIGHADGMIRFLDESTVFINDYRKEPELQQEIINAVLDSGLKYIKIPYNPYQNKKLIQANGIYINYLQINEKVFLPMFGIKEDETAYRQFEEHFKTVIPIDCNAIAKEGGILNCISWNIKHF